MPSTINRVSKGLWWNLALVTVTLVVAACRSAGDAPHRAPVTDAASACASRLAADEAQVRTDHRWTDQDVPGIGDYREIHWQARALGNPCSRVPGPTDWQYQALVRLTPADAAALAKTGAWQPSAGPPAWPALAALIPAGTSWQLGLFPKAAREVPELYLDPAQALAFFTLADG
jgi:hypothetical protein